MLTVMYINNIIDYTIIMEKIQNHHLLTGIPENLIAIAEYVNKREAIFVTRSFEINKNNILTIDVKLPRHKEDELYNKKFIRMLIPRGLCFIFVNNTYAHTLYGQTKFGNYGDYVKNIKDVESQIVKKIFKRKENGECTHWTAFKFNDVIYEVFGSKNVHLVTRLGFFNDDIKLYMSDARYEFATKMAITINNVFPSLPAIDYFLATGNTFCAEACFPDSQHVVEYKDIGIYFFAVTGKRSVPEESLTKESPDKANDIFSSLGLTSVTETISIDCSNSEGIKNTETHFELQPNSEGAVVSCLNDKNEVIYIYKHKNFNYICIRALREQMRRDATNLKITKRFQDLHIKHPSYNEILKWALHFNSYYKLLDSSEKAECLEKFVTYQNKFNALDEETKNQLFEKYSEIEKEITTVQVIMFVAIPGSGKSFLARMLKTMIENILIDGKPGKVVHLEQDMFFSKGQHASKEYNKAIEKALNMPDIKYLILTKSNHNCQTRNNTYDVLNKCKKNIERTYVVMTADDGDMKKTFQICLDRITKRGLAHTSLYGKSEEELTSILKGIFIKQYQPLTTQEQSYSIVNIDIENEKKDVVVSCVEQLQRFEVLPKFEISDVFFDACMEVVNKEDDKLRMSHTKK